MTIYKDCIKEIEFFPAHVVMNNIELHYFRPTAKLDTHLSKVFPFCHITSICEYYDVSFCLHEFS